MSDLLVNSLRPRAAPELGGQRLAEPGKPDSASDATPGPGLRLSVYTPDVGLKDPRALFQGLWRDLCSKETRELARSMTIRALAGQFRQSLLGYFWLFFPPLFNSLIFILLNREGIVSTEQTAIPYSLFVLIGNLLWQAFMQGIQSPLKAVQREMAIMTKLNIPREAVILSGFYEAILTATIPMVIVPILLLAFQVPLSLSLLLAPLGFLGLVLLGVMIGIWLTPIGTLYLDIGQAMPIVLRFLMFATPVIYPLPSEPGLARTILILNPTTPYIETTRSWLTAQPAELWPVFLGYTLLTLVLIVGGLVLYRLAMPIIVARKN